MTKLQDLSDLILRSQENGPMERCWYVPFATVLDRGSVSFSIFGICAEGTASLYPRRSDTKWSPVVAIAEPPALLV